MPDQTSDSIDLPPDLDIPTATSLARPPAQCRPPVSIRRATSADAPAAWNVLKEAVRTLAGQWYSPEQVEAWIADEDPANRPSDFQLGRTAFVAEMDRRVVGFSRLRGREVEALYVHPAEAGRQIGEFLLAAVERSASVRRVKTLCLDAALNAVPFYKALGYRIVGPCAPLFDNGLALPCVRVAKAIPSRLLARNWSYAWTSLVATAEGIRSVSLSSLRLPERFRPGYWTYRARCCKA
jgi:GNAT superfamily N-acetyltransferase